MIFALISFLQLFFRRKIISKAILITGGAGYIGSKLIRDLANDEAFQDYVIRIYDNMQRETHTALLELPDSGRYEFIEGDILDNASVRRVMQGVEEVVHLAAIVRTPLSFGPGNWIEQVNHWGTANLVEIARSAQVKKYLR